LTGFPLQGPVFFWQEKNEEGLAPRVHGGVYLLHDVYDRSSSDMVWSLLQCWEITLKRLLKDIYGGELHETEFQEEEIDTAFIDRFNTQEDFERLLWLLAVSPSINAISS
jgi:hypothetical protein